MATCECKRCMARQTCYNPDIICWLNRRDEVIAKPAHAQSEKLPQVAYCEDCGTRLSFLPDGTPVAEPCAPVAVMAAIIEREGFGWPCPDADKNECDLCGDCRPADRKERGCWEKWLAGELKEAADFTSHTA